MNNTAQSDPAAYRVERPRRIRPGVLGILALIVGLVVGAGIVRSMAPAVGTEVETLNEQVARSISLDEQVVLVSLGIQGITSERIQSTVFGKKVPGTARTSFLQYTYDAKLGIEGDEVIVEETGENQFLVKIPEFIFIGHENAEFKTVVEDNGVMSFVTPEVDTAGLITEVLNEDARDTHIDSNREVLELQARNFYSGIIHGVEPDIDLTFEFAEDNG